jgi:hypothetical protein|nr:MAG TPA: hypothetical protein [Caudoviricetes sp.]
MDVALTTADNPYDPLDQFVEWWNYDTSMGYHTAAYVARIARTSEELSDSDNQIELLKAIDEIIELNPLIPYVKIVRESETIYV